MGNMLSDNKLYVTDLRFHNGLSVYHQGTFTNMFDKVARNPNFPAPVTQLDGPIMPIE
jgi:hypothetical protein